MSLEPVIAAIQWLDRFHCLAEPVHRKFNYRACIDWAQQPLMAKRDRQSQKDRQFSDRIMERLTDLATALRDEPARSHMLHDDPSCANFLYNGSQAIGFDLHARKWNDPLIDYAHLAVDAMDIVNDENKWAKPFFPKDLIDAICNTDTLSDTPNLTERLRVHLLSACMIHYARRLQNINTTSYRNRLLEVAESLANDGLPCDVMDRDQAHRNFVRSGLE